jgi:hypothetical protein
MRFFVQLDETDEKAEKLLQEGLEKASENQDNTRPISCPAFGYPIGCLPWAGSKLADLVRLSEEDSLFYGFSQKCKTPVIVKEKEL